jgi:hypothetical protein
MLTAGNLQQPFATSQARVTMTRPNTAVAAVSAAATPGTERYHQHAALASWELVPGKKSAAKGILCASLQRHVPARSIPRAIALVDAKKRLRPYLPVVGFATAARVNPFEPLRTLCPRGSLLHVSANSVCISLALVTVSSITSSYISAFSLLHQDAT